MNKYYSEIKSTNSHKTKPKPMGISRRKGWPYLLESGLNLEGALDVNIAPEDKQIVEIKDLDMLKKNFPLKMGKLENFAAELALLYESQVLHQIIYTEFNINITSLLFYNISLEEFFSIIFDHLTVKQEEIGGYFSLVPELNRDSEENLFLAGLDFCQKLLDRGWIFGISIYGSGEIPLTSYFSRIEQLKSNIKFCLTSRIDQNKFKEEVSLGSVRRIKYFIWLDDLLETIKKQNLYIEISPTMDTSLSKYYSIRDYPFINYFRSGLPVVVSSGYPEIFGRTVENEFVLLKSTYGLTIDEIKQISLDAVDSAFVSETDKIELRQAIRNKL